MTEYRGDRASKLDGSSEKLVGKFLTMSWKIPEKFAENSIQFFMVFSMKRDYMEEKKAWTKTHLALALTNRTLV